MIAALISALTNAGGVVWDKILLSRERMPLRVFLPIGFAFIFLLSLVLVPFLGRIEWDIVLLPNTMFLVLLMVVIAVASNVLFYQTLQQQKAHQHERIMMLAPFVTVLLGAIFFREELDMRIFYLAIVASVALIWSKGTKEHLMDGPSSYNALLAVVLMSTESIIIRDLLYSFTPVALYALRTLVISVFFMLYYRPRYRQVTPKHYWMLFVSSLIGLATMLTRFYAFAELGVVYTTLVTILAPVIVFYASWEILHERLRPRMVAASLVILACVTWATVLAFG